MLTDQAPSGSTPHVIKVLETFRDTGLGGNAITAEYLTRFGMGGEVARRVAHTFRQLGLADEEGKPSKDLIAFKQAKTDEYKQVLASLLHEQYAQVFAILGQDVGSKDRAEVEDAFRAFNPDSLRGRMVSLFLGLCEYAGIIEEATARKPGRPKISAGNGRTPPRRAPAKPATPVVRTPPPPAVFPATTPDLSDIDESVLIWIKKMPPRSQPWTEQAKDRWFNALRAIVDGVWVSDEN